MDDELLNAYERAAAALLAEASSDGHWVGELSASALSTATAVAALSLLIQRAPNRTPELQPLVDQGLSWLATHQNTDGGWGDTILSVSNISTTMLARAAFVLGQQADRYPQVVTDAVAWIDRAGGVPAVHARYGTDRTFSAPVKERVISLTFANDRSTAVVGPDTQPSWPGSGSFGQPCTTS